MHADVTPTQIINSEKKLESIVVDMLYLNVMKGVSAAKFCQI
jgi:hypothetical protein